MPKITNGAELVKRLAASGTGEAKLALLRRVLADTLREERRVATADELLAALEAADGVGEVTLDKARQFAETGEYTGPTVAAADVPIEERLLTAAAKEPDPEKADAAKEPAAPPAGAGARTSDRRPGDGRR